jgi:hypothetical protein
MSTKELFKNNVPQRFKCSGAAKTSSALRLSIELKY